VCILLAVGRGWEARVMARGVSRHQYYSVEGFRRAAGYYYYREWKIFFFFFFLAKKNQSHSLSHDVLWNLDRFLIARSSVTPEFLSTIRGQRFLNLKNIYYLRVYIMRLKHWIIRWTRRFSNYCVISISGYIYVTSSRSWKNMFVFLELVTCRFTFTYFHTCMMAIQCYSIDLSVIGRMILHEVQHVQ